jgi:hypothetical protein
MKTQRILFYILFYILFVSGAAIILANLFAR